MAVASFDTLKFARQLKQAGVPPEQAEAQADALAEALHTGIQDLATKADVKELKNEIQLLRQEVKQEFQTVRQELQVVRLELKQEIQLVQQEAKSNFESLSRDLASSKVETKVNFEATTFRFQSNEVVLAQLRWMIAVFGSLIMAGVIRLLTR